MVCLQCYWLWSHGGVPDAACEVLKLCSEFFTLWLLSFLYLYYRRKFELLKATNALLPQDTLWGSGLIASTREWSFLPEALLCLVHAPPFLWCAPHHRHRRLPPAAVPCHTGLDCQLQGLA